MTMQEKKHPDVKYLVTIIDKLTKLKRHIKMYWKIRAGFIKQKEFIILINTGNMFCKVLLTFLHRNVNGYE